MLPNFPSFHLASELGKPITSPRGLKVVKCFEDQLHPEATGYEVTERFPCIVEQPKLTKVRDGCFLDKGTSYLLRQTAATYEQTFLPYYMVTPALSMKLLLLSVQQSDPGFYMISTIFFKLEFIPLLQVQSAVISFFVSRN